MKASFVAHGVSGLGHGAPTGVITDIDRFVKSTPLWMAGSSVLIVLRGRIDALVACDYGATALLDFKASGPTAHLDLYARQLHAYAAALEYPASGTPVTVSSLGLLCFVPASFVGDGGRAALCGDLRWLEVERDDAAFACFLTAIVSVLEQPEPPPGAPECPFCAGRDGVNAAA